MKDNTNNTDVRICKECQAPQSAKYIEYDGRCSNCHERKRAGHQALIDNDNTKPDGWHDKSIIDAVELLRELQNSPRMWLNNTRLKYVNIHIDTRDGAFLILDRDRKEVSLEELRKSIDSIDCKM